MVTSYGQEGPRSFKVTDNSRPFFLPQKLFASEIRNDHTTCYCVWNISFVIISIFFLPFFPPFLRVDQCWSIKYAYYYILVLWIRSWSPLTLKIPFFVATADIPIQTTLLFNSRRVAVARKILAVGERKFVLCRLFPSTVNGFNR